MPAHIHHHEVEIAPIVCPTLQGTDDYARSRC